MAYRLILTPFTSVCSIALSTKPNFSNSGFENADACVVTREICRAFASSSSREIRLEATPFRWYCADTKHGGNVRAFKQTGKADALSIVGNRHERFCRLDPVLKFLGRLGKTCPRRDLAFRIEFSAAIANRAGINRPE